MQQKAGLLVGISILKKYMKNQNWDCTHLKYLTCFQLYEKVVHWKKKKRTMNIYYVPCNTLTKGDVLRWIFAQHLSESVQCKW